jgi:hypothetical protein
VCVDGSQVRFGDRRAGRHFRSNRKGGRSQSAIAQVTFRDLKSGDVLSSKAYDTTSSAWGGVFAGMTTKQVTAMCHEIFAAIHH